MNDEDEERPRTIHPADAGALSRLLRALSVEVDTLVADIDRRRDFFQGRPLAFLMLSARPGDGGAWIELRLVKEVEVAERWAAEWAEGK